MAKTTNILNKALKHLKKNWIKYAFETLVVIIGILLALALNNWNENRLQNIKETQYLHRIVKDLQVDTIYYNNRISSSKNVITSHIKFIRKIHETQQNFEEVKFLFDMLDWNSELLTTQNTTYIELTSSGNLDILKNQNLKENVIKYYRKNEEATKHIAEFNEVSTRLLINHSIKTNGMKFYSFNDDIFKSLDAVNEKDWEFINEPHSEKFELTQNTAALYKFKHQLFLNHFETLKAMASQLIEDIEQELENRA